MKRAGGLLYLGISLCLILLADIPISRLHYHYLISSHVTPQKLQMIQHFDAIGAPLFCEGATVLTAQDELCSEHCRYSHELSEARQEALLTVRAFHPVARLMSEFFDWRRGQTQDSKIQKLLTRTCTRILQHVDHTNFWANFSSAAIGLGLLLLSGFFLHRGMQLCGGKRSPVSDTSKQSPSRRRKPQKQKKKAK